VDFATVGGSALTASLGGAPLRLLFSSFNRSLFWLFSRPEITDVKQLKDKKVAFQSSATVQPHRRPNACLQPTAWSGALECSGMRFGCKALLQDMSSYTSASAHCMCLLKNAITFSGCLPK
jgi:hypothetical protein